MIYLVYIFLFRFLPFGENSVVTGLRDILLKFRFNIFVQHFGSMFLAWYFTFFDFCLCNFRLGVSSREFVRKNRGIAYVRKGLLDILKSKVWRNSYFEEFLLVDTYCIYVFLFRFNASRKKLFVSCDYCFLFICLPDSHGT